MTSSGVKERFGNRDLKGTRFFDKNGKPLTEEALRARKRQVKVSRLTPVDHHPSKAPETSK